MRLNRILTIATCCLIAAGVQAAKTTITLKSGTTLTGELLSMDPTCCVELNVGGISTTINMGDIDKIETGEATPASSTASSTPLTANSDREKIVNIAGVDVKFILVDGATFRYGYNGDGSTYNMSEPVHSITTSPFYVTAEPISKELVIAVMGENPYDQFTIIYDEAEGHDEMRQRIAHGFEIPTEEEAKPIALFNAAKRSDELLMPNSRGTYVEGIPYAKEFVRMVKEKGVENVALLTEAQWAALYKHPMAEVRFPMNPEIVAAINMHEDKDPSPMGITLKGTPAWVSGFWTVSWIPIYDCRLPWFVHDYSKRKRKIELYEGGDAMLAPMHLTLPAD